MFEKIKGLFARRGPMEFTNPKLRVQHPDIHTPDPIQPLRPYLQESRANAMVPEKPARPAFTPNPQVLSVLKQNKPIVNMVRNTFGNEGNLALSVLLAENTRLNPKQRQIGGGPARGLWQFEPPTWKDMGGRPEQMFDPMVSTMKAKQLRDKRGWDQWSAYKNNRHQEYLPYMDLIP